MAAPTSTAIVLRDFDEEQGANASIAIGRAALEINAHRTGAQVSQQLQNLWCRRRRPTSGVDGAGRRTRFTEICGIVGKKRARARVERVWCVFVQKKNLLNAQRTEPTCGTNFEPDRHRTGRH